MNASASLPPEQVRFLWGRIQERLRLLNRSLRKASVQTGCGPNVLGHIQRAALEGRPYSPRADVLGEIARVLETTPSWLLGVCADHVTIERHYSPTVLDVGTLAAGPTILVPVVGEVAAGLWRDPNCEMYVVRDLWVAVPLDASIPDEWQFGVVVRGTSVNRTAAESEVLVCIDTIKSEIELHDGDLVIVERRRAQGSEVECTAKRLRLVEGRRELWPDSDDPEHQAPIGYDEGDDEDVEVTVIGKVVWVIKRPGMDLMGAAQFRVRGYILLPLDK